MVSWGVETIKLVERSRYQVESSRYQVKRDIKLNARDIRLNAQDIKLNSQNIGSSVLEKMSNPGDKKSSILFTKFSVERSR